MPQKIQFQLEVSRREAEAEEVAASTNNDFEIQDIHPIEERRMPALVEAQFVDPVTIMAAATLAVLAERLVNHWLRGREQGVQIDLREQPPVISRLSGIPFGFLVVINKDGTATTHKGEYSSGEELTPLLQTILAQGAS